MRKYKKTAIEAAMKSGRIIKNSVGKIGTISYKGRDNIVTDVDKRAERMIINIIRSRFPDHSILSEEKGSLDNHSRYKWIIDPLDGTTNFAHAFPFFCVSIALEIAGVVSLGVVYDPTRDELFSAELGRGAYLNGKKIKVSGAKGLAGSFLATGFSYGRRRKDKNIGNFKRLLMKTMAIRRAGSAALDLVYVACGRFDGFWELDLHPWDSAAGFLIVKEAKGKVTQFDNKPYSPYHKNILATNGKIHSRMVSLLKP
ncbi:MAG: inositol monophosphatase family protein [Candidatus Omnitrophica bacterium]|nr:inositol monophosphatase family protein [Candidatus Omnitrophota bacterium]